MTGECVIALARRGKEHRAPLPDGLHPVPGPAVVIAESYTRSPAGPYLAFAVAEPARLGGRIGLCFTTVAVNSPEVRVAGRHGWGFPAELGNLGWSSRAGERELVWLERGISIVGRSHRVAWPAIVPMRSLQHRDDGPVVANGWLRGLVHRAHVEMSVDDEDPLMWLAGRHAGASVSGLRVLMRPARHAEAPLPTPILRRPKAAPPVPAESSAQT
jgi:hypothetical protein